MKRLVKWYRWMIYALPVVLFLSYSPVIPLGDNGSMNFELSVPLIWLVAFGIVGVVMMVRKKLLFRGILERRKWVWLLFPVWLSLSVVWSLNVVRGILVVGILWLIYLAGYIMWSLRDLIKDAEFREKFWKVFFGSSLIVCGWCVLQCILDVAGVGRDYTLMCAGCTYRTFGFPHPNGFAAEPQFMGNLLLAPIFAAGWLFLRDGHSSTPRRRGRSGPSLRAERPSFLGRNLRKLLRVLLLAVLTDTLFLTLSRGAIYAFLVGMVVMSVWMVVREKKKRGEIAKRVGLAWAVVLGSFLLALNIQGLLAEVSKTDDTYVSGVNKVVNQLTLGVVDFGGSDVKKGEPQSETKVETENESGEAIEEEKSDVEMEEANFDGYVEVSTDVRLNSSRVALETWASEPRIALVGTGLGSASIVMYEKGVFPTTKEIINNQYISLLLETGVVGVSLLVVTLVLVGRAVLKSRNKVMVGSLMIAYMISLCFFSGLPNALHIYLLPVVLLVL